MLNYNFETCHSGTRSCRGEEVGGKPCNSSCITQEREIESSDCNAGIPSKSCYHHFGVLVMKNGTLTEPKLEQRGCEKWTPTWIKKKNILEMIPESVLIKMKCNGPQAIRVSLTHRLVPCSVCFRALTSTH